MLAQLLGNYDVPGQYVIKTLLAIGQGEVVFRDIDCVDAPDKLLDSLVQTLLEIDEFYGFIGGIAGYHLMVLKMIDAKQRQVPLSDQVEPVNYEKPEGLDISRDSAEVKQVVRWGIEHLQELAEIYPLGGAGDRLNLVDEKTGEALPAAQLFFCGRTLLEGLIRDLQGREYLHYKLLGVQLHTPLAIMTSHEKNNHQRILDICESHQWFGRLKDSFDFFTQILVPVVTIEGNWAMQAPLKLILKPGGHGVMWKTAQDQHVFQRLQDLRRSKVLIRQINNPVAGIDHGLLALGGIGCHKNKDFGFASCKRLVNASEGMDVLCEKKTAKGYDYCITNVEYTEFEQRGIHDVPEVSSSPFSRFPANTNILFANLSILDPILAHCPIPGMMINLKSHVNCYDGPGKVIEKQVVRLESTMQNIADFIVDHFPRPLDGEEKKDLRTFLTYNERRKTISVAKQENHCDKPLKDTPAGCFYELMENYRELLSLYCKMELPPPHQQEAYLAEGPSFIALFNPALGPLFSVIGQKINGGRIAKGGEWIMEIAEAQVVNLDLEGSLIIEAECIMGKEDARGVLIYNSEQTGKCVLDNVVVRNRGREKSGGADAWKCKPTRYEALRITIHGNGEFFAKDVVLEGNIHFEVPAGQRLVVYKQGKETAWHCERIPEATWQWNYNFSDDDSISLVGAISQQ